MYNYRAGYTGKPSFHHRKIDVKSFPIRTDKERFYFRDGYVKIEKVGKVKYKRLDRIFVNDIKFYDGSIQYKNGKWFIVVSLNCDNQVFQLTNDVIGIDLGIKNLATCSCNGKKFIYGNIGHSKRMKRLKSKEKKLRFILIRKYRFSKETKNVQKYERLYRKTCAKIANIRHNHIHQVTHDIVARNPKRIVMENIEVKHLLKNPVLKESILDASFYRFIFTLRYKSCSRGIDFVQVDRFYPSTKTCSNCGNIGETLKVSDRIFKCPVCGAVIDRDYNAALNLEKYGLNLP